MSTCGLLFFNLETWHEFHSMHTGASQKQVQDLWDSIIHSDTDVRRLEDNMGKVHLGISVEMLRGYASETAVAALLKDWLLVDGSYTAKGSRCKPCQWAARHGKDAADWPSWKQFDAVSGVGKKNGEQAKV